jgi:hypothetical protein
MYCRYFGTRHKVVRATKVMIRRKSRLVWKKITTETPHKKKEIPQSVWLLPLFRPLREAHTLLIGKDEQIDFKRVTPSPA